MSTTITISLIVPSVQATVQAKMNIKPGNNPQSFTKVAQYMEAIAGGAYAGNCTVTIGAASPVNFYVGA
jgi:hypothetical protein